MQYEQIRLPLFIIGITLVSGVGDSLGFIYAAKMWRSGDPDLSELGKSALGFSVGIGSYWLAAKYLIEFGVLSPETQTLVWFGTTMVGTAFISGKFLQWQTIDQIVAAVVLLGIAWLLFRAG
jgi:ABC-type transport system involved in multi-copper enzyme maturation permease subunit